MKQKSSIIKGYCTPHSRRGRNLIIVVLTLILFTGNSAVFAAIVDEPMTGTTAPGWILGGTPAAAILTGDGSIDPVGDGWLRLTDTGTNQAGYAYLNTPFDINSGVVIQYDYTTWGGDGADGYSIFLFDAATTPFQIGASGGSLGYAQKTVAPVSPGLAGGYVGIGIDEWGNFSNPTEGRVGGPGQRPNSVAIRGTASTSWAYLGGSAANVGQLWFNQGTRPLQLGTQYRKVVIYLTPVPAPNYLRIDVYLQFGYNQPLTPAATGIYTGQPIPANVKIGYAASTGGSTNNHEIRNLLINPLQTDINLAIYKSTPATDVNAGDTVTYTVTARNYGPNPTITATNAPITDIVPDGLTGVTWTCAGSGGATCGAAAGSGNNISTVATLPFNSAAVYTITGTASSAPTNNPFTNTATIAAPAGVVDYHLPDNSASATVRIRSDLSSSTKTVADLNGGDIEFNDILLYTITLRETGGAAASGVQITDDIPSNVDSFAVVTIPTGATDFSTFAGTGANGSGFLDIRNISVPANGSVTVTFQVRVSGPDGNTIDNSATIINPSGPGATPSAPTLTIAGSSIPASGIKQLYLQAPDTERYPSIPQALSRTPLAAYPNPYRIQIDRQDTPVRWDLTPPLATPLALNTGIDVVLWMTANSAASRDVDVTVSYDSGAGQVLLLPQQRFRFPISTGVPVLYTLSLATPATVIPAGAVLQLTIDNDDAGNGQSIYIYPVWPGAGPYTVPDNYSRIEYNAATVINVDSITFHNAAYPALSPITQATGGDTVYIRAVVSDPFGDYDITDASLDLTDGSGNAMLTGAAMTPYAESPTDDPAIKTFEYAYTLPILPASGFWTATVSANEGSEGTISDYGLASFEVPAALPSLTVLKSADRATVNPGEVITYTITTMNSGAGPATTVMVFDNLSPYVGLILDYDGVTPPYEPFDFVPGTSGLTFGTPVYYNSGGIFNPNFAAGEDDTVVRWETPMTGSFNPGSQFTLRFKVRVK